MDNRSTRCISNVFGFLKEHECQHCNQGKPILENGGSDVNASALIKTSISDNTLAESLKRDVLNSTSSDMCSNCLLEKFAKMENGGHPKDVKILETNGVSDADLELTHCSEMDSELCVQRFSETDSEITPHGETGDGFQSETVLCETADRIDAHVTYEEKSDTEFKTQNNETKNEISPSSNERETNDHSDPDVKSQTNKKEISFNETITSRVVDEGNGDDVELRSKDGFKNQPRSNTGIISDVFNFLKTETTPLDKLSEINTSESPVASDFCESRIVSEVKDLKISDGSVENGISFMDERLLASDSGKEETAVVMRRSQRVISKQMSMEDKESSDEDAGIYDETVRRSKWIRVDDDGQMIVAGSSDSDSLDRKSSLTDVPGSRESTPDEVFAQNSSQSLRKHKTHKRSDSCSTTLSEREFKREFSSTKKCMVQRNDSQQEYHRYSCKVYDEEKVITIEKTDGDTDFGLHLLDCQPAFITLVDPDSPADRAGIQEGQIVISVNGVSVLESTLDELLQLIQQTPSVVKLEVAFSDYQPVRNIQSTEYEGYMYKLGSSTLVKKWNKRYFVLRQDNCLYYYKHEKDVDPLGAIPLSGYCISRYLDTNKNFCFKAEKYNARTYYFMTDSRYGMTNWVGKLTEAAARSKKRKDSWLEVSSHNVGLPALEIRRPECSGYLIKCAPRYKTWKKRYCVLKDACIYYYKNFNSFNAQGVAHLHGYTVDPECSSSKRHSFALIPPEESMRKFYFQAENETDKNRWVDSLIRSIQRWKKAS